MNRNSYNAIVEAWDAARSALFAYEPAFLERLLRDVPAGGRILDLGCGTGRPIAEFILQQGYAVTGVDQAEALLALARQRFPAGRWLLAPMASFVPDEIYDGAVLWDALFHQPREQHETILRMLVGCLRPGARLMLTVGGSAHPAFVDSMFGQSFFYDSLTPEATEALLNALGMTVEHAEFINRPTQGRDKGRYGIVARVD